MGGGGSASLSKTNTNSTTKRKYSNTSTTNPYVTSRTTNKGTVTNFAQGSGADTFNQFYNSYIGNVLNDLVNPSIDSTRNQALVNSYANNLNKLSNYNLENTINNLSNRGLIRSSVANDMYNKMNKENANNIADYQASIIGNNQNDATNLFNTLMNAYLQNWNIINGNQAQSLQTSTGNSTQTGNTSSTTKSFSAQGSYGG